MLSRSEERRGVCNNHYIAVQFTRTRQNLVDIEIT